LAKNADSLFPSAVRVFRAGVHMGIRHASVMTTNTSVLVNRAPFTISAAAATALLELAVSLGYWVCKKAGN